MSDEYPRDELEALNWVRGELLAEYLHERDFSNIHEYLSKPTDDLDRSMLLTAFFWDAMKLADWELAEHCLAEGHTLVDSQPELPDKSPLNEAISHLGDRPDVVNWLIDHGAPIERRKWNGNSNESPLMCAARIGLIRIVQLLLDRGANIEERTGVNGNMNALMLAAKYGHLETAKLLLENGALRRDDDLQRREAAKVAQANGHIDVAKFIQSFNPCR